MQCPPKWSIQAPTMGVRTETRTLWSVLHPAPEWLEMEMEKIRVKGGLECCKNWTFDASANASLCQCALGLLKVWAGPKTAWCSSSDKIFNQGTQNGLGRGKQ